MSDIPDPANCPEPYWHQTHRYCPRCSWTEAVDPYVEDPGYDPANDAVDPATAGDCPAVA